MTGEEAVFGHHGETVELPLPVFLEVRGDGRVFAGHVEVDPASVGYTMFECPNCHVRLGVIPIIQGLSHRASEWGVHNAAGELVAGADDFIDVTFEPMPVAHNCPRRRLSVPS